MCGRYRIDDGRDSIELDEIIEAVNRRMVTEPVKTSGDIFPTDVVPVLARSRAMKPAAFAMRWGFAMPDGRHVINARSETAGEKPLFRESMRERRCAIPATSYYEWERRGKEKIKYAISPVGQPLFYLAGVYRLEGGRPAFTILTREPAQNIAFIHDRMPVILPPELAADWTDPRYRGEELLRHAVLGVAYEQSEAVEQLRMDL